MNLDQRSELLTISLHSTSPSPSYPGKHLHTKWAGRLQHSEFCTHLDLSTGFRHSSMSIHEQINKNMSHIIVIPKVPIIRFGPFASHRKKALSTVMMMMMPAWHDDNIIFNGARCSLNSLLWVIHHWIVYRWFLYKVENRTAMPFMEEKTFEILGRRSWCRQ